MVGGWNMEQERAAGRKSLPKSFAKVLLVMYILTGVMLVILAVVLYKAQISEAAVNIGIIIIYVIAGFLGGFLMGRIQKSRKFLWGAVMGLLYFAILLVVSLILHKQLESGITHVITTMILCTASGTIGGMLS